MELTYPLDERLYLFNGLPPGQYLNLGGDASSANANPQTYPLICFPMAETSCDRQSASRYGPRLSEPAHKSIQSPRWLRPYWLKH